MPKGGLNLNVILINEVHSAHTNHTQAIEIALIVTAFSFMIFVLKQRTLLCRILIAVVITTFRDSGES